MGVGVCSDQAEIGIRRWVQGLVGSKFVENGGGIW